MTGKTEFFLEAALFIEGVINYGQAELRTEKIQAALEAAEGVQGLLHAIPTLISDHQLTAAELIDGISTASVFGSIGLITDIGTQRRHSA